MYKLIRCALAAGAAASITFAAAPSFGEPEPGRAARYRTEASWLVANIVGTIADGATVSVEPVAPVTSNPSADRYDVGFPDGHHVTLDITGHLWAPVNYVALAHQLLPADPRGPAGRRDGELLSVLTTPRLETLLAANTDTSRRLAANQAGAHDDAALLLAMLALRESAGAFSDTRVALCRLTAHLAMARAFGDAHGQSARAAELTMLVLIGRQREAVEGLTAWKNESPNGAEQSWINALTLRATGDWRLLPVPGRASMLERLAYVRAVNERVGVNRVLDFLQESHPEAAVDWLRLLANGVTSVEAGNLLDDTAVELEVAEARASWSIFHPGAPASTEMTFVTALNEFPAVGGGRQTALDWPMWAAWHQRHLVMQISARIVNRNRKQGKPDSARDLARGLESAYGHLALYPVAKRQYAIDSRQYVEAMPRAKVLSAEHPELLTSSAWTLLDERFNSSTELPKGLASQFEWFVPAIPSGTAFDASHRMFGTRGVLLASPQEVARVRALAPYETDALLAVAKIKFAAKPPLAYLRQEAGEMAQYDRTIMFRMAAAAADDVDAYRPIGERICAANVDDCSALAAYLADHGRDDEAAPVYERYAEKARDRVGVSTRIEWLVRYDLAHGKQAKAVALADAAAEVYSYAGLTTKARLLERLEKFDEAEQYFETASSRYDHPDGLAAFYLRRAAATGLQKYKDLAGPTVEKIFPQGMSPLPADALQAAPQFGVRVVTAAARGAAAGIRNEDIIVSLDGVQVQTLAQYQLVRQIHERDADMSLVIWHDGRYVDVRAPLRDTWGSAVLIGYDWRQPIPW
jgi:hypothetical protein